MSPLAIAICKGLITAGVLFLAIWLIRRDGYLSGYAHGLHDAAEGEQ